MPFHQLVLDYFRAEIALKKGVVQLIKSEHAQALSGFVRACVTVWTGVRLFGPTLYAATAIPLLTATALHGVIDDFEADGASEVVL